MAQTTMPAKEAPQQALQFAPAEVKKEMEAISKSLEVFEKLAPAGRQRALSYLASALGINVAGADPAVVSKGEGAQFDHGRQQHNQPRSTRYQTFAELYDAARPETTAQRALVGGYWFQVCLGQEEFVAFDVNNELKNVGAALSNVTVSMNTLKDANPSLVLQVRKSGKAQQARKQYKLTVAGVRAVEEMIRRGA